jgi:hypothetical protein
MTFNRRMKRELSRRRRQRQVYWYEPGLFSQHNQEIYWSRKRERHAYYYAYIEIGIFCVLVLLDFEKLAARQFPAFLALSTLAALNALLALRFMQDVIRERELQTEIKCQVDQIWESLNYCKARANGWTGETTTSGDRTLLH